MGMELFCSKTVTLFNRAYDAETDEERYIPTLLEHVDLSAARKTGVSGDGEDAADTVTLFVNTGRLEKTYMSPKEWDALPDGDKERFLTFTPAEDFFARGDHTKTELPEEGAYEWMREHYDGVYKVKAVTQYEDILPHFEVGGA